MTRDTLTEAIGAIVRQNGYAFLTGPAYRMVAETGELPAAWLQSPKLEKTLGRTEGYRQYAVALSLMQYCQLATMEEKERLWAQMEGDVARICLALAGETDIKEIAGLQYSPAEFSLTNMGEISLTVNLTVKVSF